MKFTSIKQIPKEAIEMIDDMQWWVRIGKDKRSASRLFEKLGWLTLIDICNNIKEDGQIFTNNMKYFYIEPRELEDKTYGINLYKKIHGEGR